MTMQQRSQRLLRISENASQTLAGVLTASGEKVCANNKSTISELNARNSSFVSHEGLFSLSEFGGFSIAGLLIEHEAPCAALVRNVWPRSAEKFSESYFQQI